MAKARVLPSAKQSVIRQLKGDDESPRSPLLLQIHPQQVSMTNANYASWNVDSSYNRGFFHINFTNPNLVLAAGAGPETSRRRKHKKRLVYQGGDRKDGDPPPPPPLPHAGGTSSPFSCDFMVLCAPEAPDAPLGPEEVG